MAQVVLPLLSAGRIAVCGPGTDAHPDEAWDGAVDVHSTLAERGQHRPVAIPDLIIAAVAARHGIPLLHYDRDFDLIAEVTGQTVT